jgi:zinc/manganese transport system permease protein
MNAHATDWSILWPALAAGFLVAATHVPLGIQVLKRGIVFIDLAIAQIAGLGVVIAARAGLEAQGWAMQACALSAAFAGALLLTWTERRWPQVQEAIIGVSFVLAASGALLLLAASAHGGEHLQDLLAGQILWVSPAQLARVAAAYTVLIALWLVFGRGRGRTAFYLLFAAAVTISVQIVGLFLVFATLIVPALATRGMLRHRVATGYALAIGGYAIGLVVSALTDLPSGPVIVWAMTAVSILVATTVGRTAARRAARA